MIDNVVPDDDVVDHFVNKVEKLRDESHVRCYRIQEWREWSKEAGFLEIKSQVRKKEFDFPTWVRRTAKSEEQVEEVEKLLIESERNFQEYCGLVIKDERVFSIHIDEWMVLLEKQ